MRHRRLKKTLATESEPKKRFIPQIQPWLDGGELKHMTEVLESTFITENKKTEEFLERIREYTGAKYAIAMANGTLALVASLLAEGIGAGDEVLVPNLTFIATANAVRLVGATPVFVDVDLDTGCMSAETCSPHITAKTRSIMPVHLYGQIVEMRHLVDFANDRGLVIVEDSAEALGVWLDGQHAGTFGAYGIFSMFANKTITCGEGGIVLTDCEERYRQLYRVKNHGRDRKGIFVHEAIGYNFCFTDLQAAIGTAQMEKLPRILDAKKNNYDAYNRASERWEHVRMMSVPSHVKSNYWFCNVLTSDPDQFVAHLMDAGIQTRRFFYPLDRQPCYADMVSDATFPNSHALYEQGVSLPSSSTLTADDLQYICDAIASYSPIPGQDESS